MMMMMMVRDASGPGPHSTAGARRRDAVRDARLVVGPVGVVLLVVAFAFAFAFAFARVAVVVASSVAGGRRPRAERRARRRRPEMDRRYGSILARRGVGARGDGERARR